MSWQGVVAWRHLYGRAVNWGAGIDHQTVYGFAGSPVYGAYTLELIELGLRVRDAFELEDFRRGLEEATI
jgi:hypothetical protein